MADVYQSIQVFRIELAFLAAMNAWESAVNTDGIDLRTPGGTGSAPTYFIFEMKKNETVNGQATLPSLITELSLSHANSKEAADVFTGGDISGGHSRVKAH